MVSYAMSTPEREEMADTQHMISLDEFYTNCMECGDQTCGKPYCGPCLDRLREEVVSTKEALLSQRFKNSNSLVEIEELDRVQKVFDSFE